MRKYGTLNSAVSGVKNKNTRKYNQIRENGKAEWRKKNKRAPVETSKYPVSNFKFEQLDNMCVNQTN